MARVSQRVESNEEQTGTISLTIRPWALAAVREGVAGEIGPCMTAARSLLWVEIIYEINDAPLFYTRHILQRPSFSLKEAGNKIFQGKSQHFTWFSDCPNGSLTVGCTENDKDRGPRFSVHLSINLSWFLQSGERSRTEFVVDNIDAADMLRFVLELESEIAGIYQGQCPDPAVVPAEFITLPAVSVLTKRAYAEIGESYHADYLADPFFQKSFSAWLDRLPANGVLLDIGCGHGEPITKSLVDQGFAVTGIDIAPQMLDKARQKIAGATFREQSVSQLDDVNLFDGACCFFSLLHLDPVELRVALWRVYRALKPGGHLLIVSGTPDVNSRSSPYTTLKGQPIWEWHYDLQDIELALIQRGLFEIVERMETINQDESTRRDEHPESEDGQTAAGIELLRHPVWLDSPVLPMAFAILARRTT
jgi:SAM-dependent methyltransferase